LREGFGVRETRRTIIEALILAAVSLVLGLGVNAVNDEGVIIFRQNFPKLPIASIQTTQPSTSTAPASTVAANAPSAGGSDLTREADARLMAAGINIARYEDLKALLSDQLFNVTKHLIDARDDEHYQQGHIAGAHQLFPYQIDRFLPGLLPLLLPAEKVIIYCNGGDCVDSESTAIELIQRGVTQSKIFVYTGGYQDWIAHHEQLEKGDRGSGNLIPAPAH
jgi:rhodanese-related sulfurtransferase